VKGNFCNFINPQAATSKYRENIFDMNRVDPPVSVHDIS